MGDNTKGKKRGRPRKTDQPEPDLSPLQLKVLELDAAHPSKPLAAQLMAERLNASRKEIYRIRKLAFYQAALAQKIAELNSLEIKRMAAELSGGADKKNQVQNATRIQVSDELNRIQKNLRVHWTSFIERNWIGPVVSLFDDKTYATPNAYLEHCLQHKLVPADLVTAVIKREAKEKTTPQLKGVSSSSELFLEWRKKSAHRTCDIINRVLKYRTNVRFHVREIGYASFLLVDDLSPPNQLYFAFRKTRPSRTAVLRAMKELKSIFKKTA
jgi:hypothetical protein